MIISKQKPFEEILNYLKGKDKIFITGCSLCATSCMTGGQQQIDEMKEKLEKQGKDVTGSVVLDPSCHKLQARATLRKQKAALAEADALLCMACGNGAQTVANLVKIPVYPANDTLFIGEIERIGEFAEACKVCGRCELGWSAAICPITKCAKSLLNGPCGGAENGKCEVNPQNDCAWVLIYNRLEEQNLLHTILDIKDPKDYSKGAHPRKLAVGR